jgi:cytoskeletal protein RodZ
VDEQGEGAGTQVDQRPAWRAVLAGLPWKRLAVIAVGLFVVAMATILAFELVTGRAVSTYTGGSDKDGPRTSFGGNAKPDKDEPKPTKSTESTPAEPTSTPTESTPTTTATTTAPPEETEEPTTTAPTTTAPTTAPPETAPAAPTPTD